MIGRLGLLARPLWAVFGARVLRDRRGGVMLMFALLVPCLVVVAAGGVEIASLTADRARTQDVADAAALMGAKQLAVAPIGAVQRAEGFAQGELDSVASHADVTVSGQAIDASTIKIAVDTHRMSFFGNLFPPGGFFTHSEATAATVNKAPLCVLIMGPATSDDIHLTGKSKLDSPCLVHSNEDLTVDAGAAMAATTSEAGTSASGPITPAAFTGAPAISDPFVNLNLSPVVPCLTKPGSSNVNYTSSFTLLPGTHDFDITIVGSTVLTLAPGEHYFCGNLTFKGTGSISGTDVVMIFENGTKATFKGASSIALTGRKSGPLAGFVMATDRSYTGTFLLQSDPITTVTGAIYAPNAVLQIDGTSKAGQASDWTVLAARSLQLTNSPDLVINTNYSASPVPVPIGVGQLPGDNPRLVK